MRKTLIEWMVEKPRLATTLEESYEEGWSQGIEDCLFYLSANEQDAFSFLFGEDESVEAIKKMKEFRKILQNK
jgi:hypothetical protein